MKNKIFSNNFLKKVLTVSSIAMAVSIPTTLSLSLNKKEASAWVPYETNTVHVGQKKVDGIDFTVGYEANIWKRKNAFTSDEAFWRGNSWTHHNWRRNNLYYIPKANAEKIKLVDTIFVDEGAFSGGVSFSGGVDGGMPSAMLDVSFNASFTTNSYTSEYQVQDAWKFNNYYSYYGRAWSIIGQHQATSATYILKDRKAIFTVHTEVDKINPSKIYENI